MKTFYQLLDVADTASADDIKRAFRREIAKYHPDKVQHLGQEFQEIAVSKAAELTQAYKTLSDPAARADYDAQLAEGGGAATYRRPSPPPAAEPPPHHPPPPAGSGHTYQPPPSPPPPSPPAAAAAGSSVFAEDRAGALGLIQRAIVMRFRQVLGEEFSGYEEAPVPGFDVTCIPKQSFWSRRPPPCVLGRVVPRVDAAAVTETWTMATRMKRDANRDVCIFTMGPVLAPAAELASAIAQQRRKQPSSGGRIVLVPLSTGNWQAHVPADAPSEVKSLLKRLRSAV